MGLSPLLNNSVNLFLTVTFFEFDSTRKLYLFAGVSSFIIFLVSGFNLNLHGDNILGFYLDGVVL